jgi:hypothetical protein
MRVLLTDVKNTGTSSWVSYSAGVVVLSTALVALIRERSSRVPPGADEVVYPDDHFSCCAYGEWAGEPERLGGDTLSAILNDEGWYIDDQMPEGVDVHQELRELRMVVNPFEVFWHGQIPVEKHEGVVILESIPVPIEALEKAVFSRRESHA